MERIHLATALVRRGDDVLLVASRYPSHPRPLWNLPGGRQIHGELLEATALRELYEETGLRGVVRRFAYLVESYDGDRHFVNAAFVVDADGEPVMPGRGDHVSDVQWVPLAQVRARLEVTVVREPLLRYLESGNAYTGIADAGVSVRWFDE